MSKRKNGKHISGDPRKNSKPMYYKGINKEKKPEILCSRIIYDSMVEKTSREIKNMGIMDVNNPESNRMSDNTKEMEKMIRDTLDDDDLDFLSTFLWKDSPYPQFNSCDSVFLYRLKEDKYPYFRLNTPSYDKERLNYKNTIRYEDIDFSKYIYLGKRDTYNENSKRVRLVKVGREVFQLRMTDDEITNQEKKVGWKQPK